MNEREAFKIFVERIGRPEEPYRDSFREIWTELTERISRRMTQFTCDEALSLLVEWYGDENSENRKRNPLWVIETYRRPRAWVIFLCWRHQDLAKS